MAGQLKRCKVVCNNSPQFTMLRIFLIGFTLLLLLSSLGHLFAAAFCPRPQGHECCLKKTGNHLHESSSSNHDMPMDGMVMDDMAMNDSAQRHTETPSFPAGADAEALANKFDQPVEPLQSLYESFRRSQRACLLCECARPVEKRIWFGFVAGVVVSVEACDHHRTERIRKAACSTWQNGAPKYPHLRFSDLVPSWRFRSYD